MRISKIYNINFLTIVALHIWLTLALANLKDSSEKKEFVLVLGE